MQETVSSSSRVGLRGRARLSALAARVRSAAPSLSACSAAIVSAALLIVSFPDFDLWPLAWLALVPLFLGLVRSPQPGRAFFMGWVFGAVFFFGSCYWLTYSMINFGRISPSLAFVLLLPGDLLLGLFPAVFTAVLSRAITKWGVAALFLASPFWSALEWARLETTGQLWNARGYSQAYHPLLIQTAGWGGVYAVGFLIVSLNAAITFALLQRRVMALVVAGTALLLVAGAAF